MGFRDGDFGMGRDRDGFGTKVVPFGFLGFRDGMSGFRDFSGRGLGK